jgi:predicted DNA-binding protein
MATMTIRLPDEKQKRLAQLAKHLGVSVNKLIDEIATVRLAQFDAEIRFRRLAQKGSIQQGLKVLDKLDRAFAKAKRD